MAKKYLDLDGLSHFWQAIKNAFVADVTYDSSTKKIQKTKAGTTSDVVTLSTVATSGSYSDLSNKPSIPTLKNVFGKVKVGSTTIEADTTQDTLEIAGGTGISVSGNATDDKVTIASNLDESSFTYSNGYVDPNAEITYLSGASLGLVTETAFTALNDLQDEATTSSKGLMSSADKTKLNGIASGAEVNQNAFSNIKVGSTTVAADSKTDTVEFVAGSNITLTPDATNDKITIKATNTTYSDFVSATADAAGQHGLVPAPHQGASAGSVLCEDGTWKPVMVLIGNNAVERAKADASGNTITTTYAPKASPALTGTPTAPTATAGTNSTQIATTAFVTSAVQTAITGAAAFQGTAPTSFAPTNYKKGYYWVVGTAGTYAGQVCEPGDMIFAVKDYGSAYAAADFNVIQTNLDITSITNAEIDTIVAA